MIEFRDAVAFGHKPGYVNNVLGTLRLVFKLAFANEYITKDVSRTVPNLKAPKCTAKENIHRTLEQWEQDSFIGKLIGNYYYLFICLMLYTGMRQGEVAALKADDIDENYIYVRRITVLNEHSKVIMGKTTKTYDSTREIPINDKIRSILDQLEMPTDDSTIFKAPRGGLVQNACVNRAIRDTLKKLKEDG